MTAATATLEKVTEVKDRGVEVKNLAEKAPHDNPTSPTGPGHAVWPMKRIAVASIETDRDLQARQRPLDDAHVESLREAIQKGEKRKGAPVVVFEVVEEDKDGNKQTHLLLADGFHWLAASIREGKKFIEAELRQGTRTDALRYALQANATHGLPRTTADKERAIELCLKDSKLSKLSNAGIARACMVSQGLVDRVREQWEKDHPPAGERVGSDGRVRRAHINTRRRKTPEAKAAREAAVKLAGAANEETAARLSKPQKGMVDDVGAEVPEALRQTFAARTDIRGLLAILTNAKVKIESLRKADVLVWAPKTLESNLDAVISDLNTAMPAVVKEGHKHGFLSLGQFGALNAGEKKKLVEAATAEEPEVAKAA
jgi:hypothetical protein